MISLDHILAATPDRLIWRAETDLGGLTRGELAAENNRYRYILWRLWDPSLDTLLACLLNPSHANHQRDDNTTNFMLYRARLMGYGSYLAMNLFAIRDPDSSNLKALGEEAVGPDHATATMATLLQFEDRAPILGWGVNGELLGQGVGMALAMSLCHMRPQCFGTTKDGHPIFPSSRNQVTRGSELIPFDLQGFVDAQKLKGVHARAW